MIKNPKKFKLLIAVLGVVMLVWLIAVPAYASHIYLNIDYPDIPMPGGAYDLNCIQIHAEGEPRCQLTIANVVLFLYGLALWLGGAVAFVSLIYTGFQFVISGQSPSVRAAAKDRLEGVLWGIGILLTTVLILNIINPDITNVQDPTLDKVKTGNPPSLEIPDPTITDQQRDMEI